MRRLAVTVLVLVSCGSPASDPADAGVADAGAADAGGARDAGPESGAENTDARCSDGVSNDGDRFVDCDDYDCSRTAAVTVCGGAGADAGTPTGKENTDALCSDGKSNDGDTYVDCDDYDCSDNEDVTVCGGECFACLDEVVAVGGTCRAEAQACEAQGPCATIRHCVAACADDACDLACQDAEPDGWTLYDALMNCVFAACKQAC